MKAQERQLSLIAYLLHHHFGRTLEEILRDIPDFGTGEAGRKKFQRDRILLRELGLPLECVEQEGENEDGNLRYLYLLDKRQVFARRLRLTTDERRGLLALCDALLEQPGYAFAAFARSAREKLLAAGAVADAGAGPRLPDRPAPPLARAGEEALGTLLLALETGRCVRFSYQGLQHDTTSSRIVHPHRLIAWRGGWLLMGHCELRGASRSFQVKRVRSVELLEQPACPGPRDEQRPGMRAWEMGLGEGLEARVRFDADVVTLVERALRGLGIVRWTVQADGGAEAVLPVEDASAFIRWLLSWGRKATLLGPRILQTQLANELDAVVVAMGGV